MAIILDEENNVVTVENQPDAPRAMFKNLPEASTIEGDVADVLINGTSIVDEHGDANIPLASESAFGAVGLGDANTGIALTSANKLRIARATASAIKNSGGAYVPIVPDTQHQSTFYGLAKAASDTTQSASSNPVGQYTDAAKVAIQKMLGVYEAPWELIRGDTFTNAEEANYTIDTDMNNQPFELTDIYLEVWLDGTNQASSVANPGRVDAYYSETASIPNYFGSGSVEQGGNAKGACLLIKQEKGGTLRCNTPYAAMGTDRNPVATPAGVDTNRSLFIAANLIFQKITISAVTGTMAYRLYGKRKWQ